MNKKERFQAVRERRAPDCMPVWPRVMAQMIYAHGLMLPDITGQDWFDSDKVTEAVLASIKNVGYDVAIPMVYDRGWGVPPLGGSLEIPNKFGLTVAPVQPVKTKADWPKVRELLAKFDARKTDPRMKGGLEVIKNVSKEVGGDVPLVGDCQIATGLGMILFRTSEAFLEDMTQDPEWVDEMCSVATDWALDWIRAQYEAGANSVTFISDVVGTLMASPEMGERFNLPSLCRIVEMVKKEFKQGVWLHIHGDMRKPRAYEYLTKMVMQAGIEGIHFDENNPPDWIKEHVVDKFGVAACIITDGGLIVSGPPEKIRENVKNMISKIGDGLGIMMAPSCQVLPATSNENFKVWVDATHEYGKYPLRQ